MERKVIKLSKEAFDDSHDVEKHILDIHSSTLTKVLSNDLVMAVLDDREKTFISNNIQSAHEAEHIIKDSDMGKYCASRLLLKAYTVAILNRNIKGNPIIELLLNKQNEDILQQPDGEVDKAIMEKLDRDKRGKK